MTLQELMAAPQYSIPQERKERILLAHLNELTARHQSKCDAYARLLETVFPDTAVAGRLREVPYVPVGLFKSHLLSSIPPERVFRTLTSSGTTGQQVSRVVLDRETAGLQSAALASIMMHVLGRERLPMIVVDTPAVLKDRTRPSARAAGVLGMMNFGRNHFWALNDDMRLDRDGLQEFLLRHASRPILLFGFTFMVWACFFEGIRGLGLDLSNGILVHSGGWKKMESLAVDNAEFRRRFRQETGLERIYNFYGMAEQAGSVFLEGEDGLLYPSNFADVIVRDPATWEEAPPGRRVSFRCSACCRAAIPGIRS